MKRHTLLAIAALATACDPCHGWDEVKIVDRTGLDQGEAVSSVADAIDTFAGWTGRETTCVGRVKVVEELEHRGLRVSGQYNGVTGDIRIRHRVNEWAMGEIAIHELCHAVDDEEGWPSEGMAQVLEPYTGGLNEVLYATDDERTHEAFANICAEGPVLFTLWQQLEDACGEDVVDEAYQVVHELLYSGLDVAAELGSFEATVDRWEFEGVDDHGATRLDFFLGAALVAGEAGLVGLELLVILDEAGKLEAWQPVLRHIDPHVPAEQASLALEPIEELVTRDHNNNPYYQSHELIGSSSDPLIYDRTQPGRAWRVRGDPMALEELAFPVLPQEAIIRGFEHQGSVLAWVRTAEDSYIATASLKDAAWTPVSFEDDERFEGTRIYAFEADTQGAVILLDGPSGLAAAGLSWEGTPLWYQGLGCGDCRAYSVSRLPDGSVLVPTWVSTSGQSNSIFPIRIDLSDGTLGTPTGDCSNVGYYLGGATWDGGRWMLYPPEQDDGSRGPLELLRLHVQPM